MNLVEEAGWFCHALPLVEKEVLTAKDAIAWTAYHALHQPCTGHPPALRVSLPLLYEKSSTPAMVKHGMDVQKQAIEYLNPGQILVTTFDQPVCTSNICAEEMAEHIWCVVMLGGLHTDMALWNTLGDVLEDSGWTRA